jgi:2-succinyl-6-hydroxy-2,4-cyclohexadiene-1-carboxylate synthase
MVRWFSGSMVRGLWSGGAVTRIAVNGISLNVERSGDGSGPPLLLLHGFTRDHREWEPLLPCFDSYRTIRVDLIGHGKSDSPSDVTRYSMADAVDDLMALLHHLDIERTALLGYSLGGRVALHLAAEAPELLWALVIESASPGIEDLGARDARAAGDEQLALSIERDGVEAFVERWQSQSLFASQSRLAADVLEWQKRQRLDNSARGLANSLRGMGAGAQEYLLPRMAAIDVPALFIAGDLDEHYAKLAARMASEVPAADCRIIEGAGHTTHLEQPEAFAAAAGEFLARHRPRTPEEN